MTKTTPGFPIGETTIPSVGFGTYHNEAGVGDGIRAGIEAQGLAREDVFVTTKLWPGNAAWGDAPKGYDETRAAFEASRAAMGLDVIDLYLIHAPSGGAPDANQIELHPWTQKRGLVGYMRDNGILPIAYSSLAPLSTWRHVPGQASSKTEEMKAEATPFADMAAGYGVTEAQLLLRWGVQNGYCVLPKSLDPARMRANLDLFGFEISAADMAAMAAMDRGDEGIAWATGDPRHMG